jgi:F-type H+-transporting ATPase subunit delta
MKSQAAAHRYAKALFGLAKEEHRLADVRQELSRFAELLDLSPELRGALQQPLHPANERKAVLKALAAPAELSRLLVNFCSFLIDQRRLVDFQSVREEFDRLADEEAGLTTAEVVSASPLDDRRRDRLRRALSERTGREVRLEVSVDPGLIGGAVAKVGDLVFDGSIRTQLSQLRANLTKGQ